jgi:3-hydroxyacyl-CoA dehydrogenase
MIIEKAAVIGAGVMGASIAAHLSNAGVPVLLLDIVPEGASQRNQLAESAIAKLLKTEPAAFMLAKNARLITPGNLDDDLEKLAEVDWVIEAVIENLSIKQKLYHRLESICPATTLISSNTSTLPLKLLMADAPESLKRRFMITHFFNPPRYMRLLELISGTETLPEFQQAVAEFADLRLGKDCVICKDTPGFIANRIGTFWITCGVQEAIKLGLTVEEADAAIAKPFGIPKTGIFGLLDLVGIDLIPFIVKGFNKMLQEDDAFRKLAPLPDLINHMIAAGHTGRKGKGGFYRLLQIEGQRVKESINLKTGDYGISIKPQMDLASDLKSLLSGNDKIATFCWNVISQTLCYAASLLPEIAEDPVAVDTAMKQGFNWTYGPFELIDRIGAAGFCDRLHLENRTIPALLDDRNPFYTANNGKLYCKDLQKQYQPVRRSDGVLLLSDYKLTNSPVLNNRSASLWDLGDGIACLEFHSKMNTLDMDTMTVIRKTIDKIGKEFAGLVIYNEAEHFSAGANLSLLVNAIKEKNTAAIANLIRVGQETYQAIKYAPFPVVGAPSGLALGGGCEILLHCDAIQAHAELYMGLVEAGVGLLPGWGGCKEYLHRQLENKKRYGGPIPPVIQAFETIGMAKVSKSAFEAKTMLFLSSSDGITMNRSRLLADAKAKSLALSAGYQPPEPYQYNLPGKTTAILLKMASQAMHLVGKITAYDTVIADHLAQVLSGGDSDITQPLTEEHLMSLELNAFLALTQKPESLARLEHMLQTGKPLRN